jgi:hypothetical protein
MITVTLTFDSYEEAVRVKGNAINILNEYMSGEDPYEHKNHGTPENALEILVDALHKQVPQIASFKGLLKYKDSIVGTETGIIIDGKEYVLHYIDGHAPVAVLQEECFKEENIDLMEKVMGSRDDAEDTDAWDDFKSALEGEGDD